MYINNNIELYSGKSYSPLLNIRNQYFQIYRAQPISGCRSQNMSIVENDDFVNLIIINGY